MWSYLRASLVLKNLKIMETKLNIAEILKDKPKGTKLYNLLYNIDMELDTVITTDTETIVWCTNKIYNNDICRRFYSEFGTVRGYPDGLQILKPSKEMQDWEKFTWKKGDVLMAGVDNLCIFDKWNNNEYTEFDAAFVTPDYRSDVLKTKYWHKVISETIIKRHISNIERNYGGKLNLTTLEIEEAQPEFKDGDIAYADYGNKQAVFIVSGKTYTSGGYNSFIALDLSGILDMERRKSFFKKDLCKLRHATEEEEQQLFDALAKENKAWDAEKKQIVDLEPEWTPKPFDRVITRNAADDIWTANIFSHMDSYGEYVTIACVGGYTHCLPYNDKTAKLIGTTNTIEED